MLNKKLEEITTDIKNQLTDTEERTTKIKLQLNGEIKNITMDITNIITDYSKKY
jgi:DNA integrity scanning protein DisA with diadenylate cyclase activity